MKKSMLILLLFLAGAVFIIGGCNGGSTNKVPPTVTLSLTGSPMAEAAGAATVTATLSNGSSGLPVTVGLAFSGTAALTDDYTLTGTSILIPAGDTQGFITLTAVPDTLDENDETIIVEIESVTNGTESGAQQVTATIADDDEPPVAIQISGTVATGAPLSTAVVTAVNVLGSSAGPVNVNADGTYTLSVNDGAPYLLKAYSAQADITLFSYSAGNTMANITPLTNLALFAAAGLDEDLAVLYSTWKNNPIPESDVMTATRLVNANFAALYMENHVDAKTYNFFETPFSAGGNGIDGVLGNLELTIDPEAPTMDTLVHIVTNGQNNIIFDPYVDISDFFLIDRITPAAAFAKISTGDALLVCSYDAETCKTILMENTLQRSELEQEMDTLPKSQDIIFY